MAAESGAYIKPYSCAFTFADWKVTDEPLSDEPGAGLYIDALAGRAAV